MNYYRAVKFGDILCKSLYQIISIQQTVLSKKVVLFTKNSI